MTKIEREYEIISSLKLSQNSIFVFYFHICLTPTHTNRLYLLCHKLGYLRVYYIFKKAIRNT